MRAGLRAFVLPLVTPLATAHGEVADREGFLVTLEDEAGRFGTGEATPLPAFGGEDRAACREALLRALPALADGSPRSLDAAAALVARACVGAPCARAALEGALADLAAQREDLSLAHWIRRRAGLPGEPAARVLTQALVGGSDPDAVLDSARRARAAGFEVFKLKLAVAPGAGDVARDLERTAALRAAIGPDARIRLDANEAWDRRTAERALAQLAPFGIELVEQPVPRRDLDALAALDRAGPIPVAADEALLGDGLEACLSRRCPRIFIVKPAALGGIARTIELAARAREAGIRIVYSNLIEGRVGREGAVALAAGLAVGDVPASARGDARGILPGEPVHGLGTAQLLARDFDRVAAAEPGSGGGPAKPTAASVLVPHAGAGLGASPGPCWAVEGEIYGALHDCIAPSPSALHAAPSAPFALRAACPSPASHAAVAGDAIGPAASAKSWLARMDERHAERDALCFGDRRVSWRSLARAARAAGEQLAACGIGAGDLVAVLAPPSPEGVVLFHAMFEREIVLLPLNTRLSEPELARALASTRATALLASQAVDLAQASRLAQGAGCLLLVFETSKDPGGLAPEVARAPRLEPAYERVESVARAGATRRGDRSARAAALRRDRAALVLQTSGTSGRPKAAVLTRENLVASAEASAQLLGSGCDDRWLLCMPLFHIAGLSILVRAALAGACVCLEPRFDAARVATVLDASRISHVSLVATTLAQVLDARGSRRAPASLRLVLVGGGPVPERLLARALAAGYPIAPTYGLTEASSQVATRPPPRAGAREGRGVDAADLSGGLVPLPGVELRIVDEGGRPVGAGVEGEIEVRGPIVMRGYLDDPEATARTLRAGWLATGDAGRLDEQGRLRVLDRRSDLILSGGENVYPAEIESVLAEHPDVVEAGVVGVPDVRFGARPLAVVVWRAGSACDAGALDAWCRARLAGYKVPVDFVAADSLPRNASGKLLRRALAERVRDGAGTV